MQCFQDYIGIKGCTFAESDSGLYLNDLPGVEFQNIDQIANAEQANYAGVWSDVQKLGLRKFKLDVIAEFAERYHLNEISQTVNLGKGVDTSSSTAHAAELRGFIIELNQQEDTFVNSNLQLLAIQTLSLYLPAAVTLDIKIFDLDTGEELFTKTVTGALGWNQVQVNKVFGSRRIFCCYDATAVDSKNFDLSNFDLQSFFGQGDCDCGCSSDFVWFWWNRQCTARVQGAYAPKASTINSVTSGLNTFGLSGVFSIKCGYDNVVCLNKEHFATALLYCLGAQLMTERIYSSRLNQWTTIGLDQAKRLRQEFELTYKGGKVTNADGSVTYYPGELKKAVEGITLDTSDCCLECDGPFRFQEAQF